MIRIIIIERARAWTQGTQTDICVVRNTRHFGRHHNVSRDSQARIMRMAAAHGWTVEYR